VVADQERYALKLHTQHANAIFSPRVADPKTALEFEADTDCPGLGIDSDQKLSPPRD